MLHMALTEPVPLPVPMMPMWSALLAPGYDLVLSCWRPAIDRLLAASAAAAAPAAAPRAAAAAPAPVAPAGAGKPRDRPRVIYRFPDLPSALPNISPFDPAAATVSAASGAAVVAVPNPDSEGPAPGGRHTASLPAPAPEPIVLAGGDSDAASSLIWTRAAAGRASLMASRVAEPAPGFGTRANAPAPEPLVDGAMEYDAASNPIWTRAAAGRATLLAGRATNLASGFATRANAPAPVQARQALQDGGSLGAGLARMLPAPLAGSAANPGAAPAAAEQPQLAIDAETEDRAPPSGHAWLSTSG